MSTCQEQTRRVCSDAKPFYSGLTPFYHLIYPDWDKSIGHQGEMLDSVIREIWGNDVTSVLDVSCGIGTQALGLAQLGYDVRASDLSPEEVARARKEAEGRGLSIAFSVADMRDAFFHHDCQFDIVLSCDNSVPHLLTDDDILRAFQQFYQCTRPGGGCIISVRDYEQEDLSDRKVRPYAAREQDGARWVLWQVWEPHGATYDVTMHITEARNGRRCRAHVFRSTYYAIGTARLRELLTQAGFTDTRRLDGRFFQPLLIGAKGR